MALPLKFPKGWPPKDVSRLPKVKTLFSSIPVLGYFIDQFVDSNRRYRFGERFYDPLENDIRAQLEKRTASAGLFDWRSDEIRVVAAIATTLETYWGIGDLYLHPDDPATLLLWYWRDGLAIPLQLHFELDDAGIELPVMEIVSIVFARNVRPITLRQFVAICLKHERS